VALAELAARGGEGRRVVVTPGMVELGPLQFEGEQGIRPGDRPHGLRPGHRGPHQPSGPAAGSPPLRPLCVRTRDEAVTWVRATLGPGDAVLYENDPPGPLR